MAEDISKYFFIPWKGSEYEKGLVGKKTLVIGASHYCNHSSKCVKGQSDCVKNKDGNCSIGCKNFDSCTNGNTFKYNTNCEYMKNSASHSCDYFKYCKELGIVNELRSTTIDEVCIFLDPTFDDNRSYSRFSDYMIGFFGEKCSNKIDDFCSQDQTKVENRNKYLWNHIAFANLSQNFQPSSSGNTFLDEDLEAFNSYIYELDPDIVIVWGDVGNFLYSQGKKEQIKENDFYTWENEMCTRFDEKKKISFLHSYHPSYGGYMDNGYLDKAMKRLYG